MRETIVSVILRKFEEDYPTLFDIPDTKKDNNDSDKDDENTDNKEDTAN